MRNSGTSILAVSTLLLAACGNAGASDLVVRADSAGIEIVTNDVASNPAVCTVDATPVTRIGIVQGGSEYELYRVFGATALSDGRIALVNQGSQQLRVYDADGRHLFSAGGKGQGPGEFTNAFHLWRMPGDTIWVGDYRPWQFHVFSPDGEYVRTVRPRPEFGNTPAVMEVLPDGRQLLAVRPFTSREPGWHVEQLSVVVHAPDGAAGDTLGTYPNGRWGRLADHPNLGLFPLFESFFRIDASGDVVAIGHSSESQLEVRDAGDLAVRRIVRWHAGPRDITAADIAAEHGRLAERYEGMDPAMQRELIAPLISEERPVADRFPAFVSMRVARDGRVWLREFLKPTEDRQDRWMVFDDDGAFRCRVVLPESRDVLELGADYVLAKVTDDIDVEQVVKWRVSLDAVER